MLEKMKFNRILLIAAAFALAASSSCKKDDDDDTYSDYMSGTLTFSAVDGFLDREETVTLTPSGITEPECVGYYWYTSWDSTKDTTRVENGSGDGTFTVKVPYDLGEYKINCVAFADGYYTSSASTSFYVVSSELNTTVKNANLNKDSYLQEDARDGRSYYCTKTSPRWFKSNLAYSGSGVSYYNSPVMDMIVGKFYSWEEAVKACPEGWRLPNDSDFAALASQVAGDGSEFKVHEDFKDVAGGFMVDATFLDEKLWEFWPQVKITNSTGLCVMPFGYCVDAGSTRFLGFEEYAAFWTADEEGENAFYRYIYYDKNDVLIGKGNKESFRASVRCVRDI